MALALQNYKKIYDATKSGLKLKRSSKWRSLSRTTGFAYLWDELVWGVWEVWGVWGVKNSSLGSATPNYKKIYGVTKSGIKLRRSSKWRSLSRTTRKSMILLRSCPAQSASKKVFVCSFVLAPSIVRAKAQLRALMITIHPDTI